MATIATVRDAVVKISVEELIKHLPTLEAELSEAGSMELVRDGKVIAEMRAPRQKSLLIEPADRPIPDFMARLRAIWGDKPLDVDTTAMIREDRDSRG
jgi:hypothetical protein